MTASCEKSEELMQWLAAEFSENVIESLKGQSITQINFKICLCPAENEIDVESFLLLTDADIFDMVKPEGS